MSDQPIFGILMSRETLFRLLREEFTREPKDEAGIKICDEWIEKLGNQITDVVINGTSDQDQKLIGTLLLSKRRK
jgi:hypothetical protein